MSKFTVEMNDSFNASVPALPNDLSRLQTIVPSAVRKRGGTDSASGSTSVASTLKGLREKTQSTLDLVSLPAGWARVKHPESGVYYVHAEKNLSTSADVLKPGTHKLIMKGADVLLGSAALQEVLNKDQKVDLVLDVQQRGGATTTSYYCVSHVERQIFWLEGIGHEEVDIPCPSNRCIKTTGSRVHCIEAQYWKHCELFPTTFKVTKDITRNLKDALLQAAADRLLVKFSTSPYGKEDLEYMLNVVKEVEEDIREEGSHGAWIIAKFMALYNDGVLKSSYGQSDDYFDIEDEGPVIGPYERPLLLAILAPFFFKSPDVYAGELHSFHENFTLARWSSFVHKVDQSIRDSNLLATVLLTTNVGFLAWADAAKTGGIESPTPVQIVTYVSIICSVGSIIIGLVIFKQYRAKGADTPLRAVVVLKRILKEPFGLERLAIICSLPYVLLMWGLIAFLGAFGIVFYQNTGIQVRIPITVTFFLVALCLFFCFYTAGPPDKEDKQAEKRSTRQKVSSLPEV